MADVFLSYNREDQAKAKIIAEALEAQGFEVWWDTVLRAGQTYDEVTEGQLRDARAVIVLWSSRSVRSKWVRAEATLGDRKSALIPVMIEQCDRPIMFELIQTADLTRWNGDLTDPNWLDFLADVREHVERKRGAAKAAEHAAPAAPVEAAKPAESANTVEAAFWMSVHDGDDASDFEAYLERYPEGHFAKLARKRLKALEAQAAPVVEAAPPPPVIEAPPPPPVEPPPVQAAPPPPVEPPPPPVAAPPLPLPSTLETPRAPTPPPRPPAPPITPSAPITPRMRAPEPAPRRKAGPNPVLIAGGAGLLVILVAAVVFWPKPQTDAPATEIASAPAPVAPPVEAAAPAPVEAAPAPTETTFRDCPECPEMARLEGGSFVMGSPANEAGRRAWEGPQRTVEIAAFAIGVREVSFAEWDACVAAGGCGRYAPPDRGWGRGARPVLMVSWNDAQAYVRWLNERGGHSYRLPSEAEWEFAARGGTTTAYWWGDRYDGGQVTLGRTSEAGAHGANGFGLFDVTGNVSEWVEDCYVNGFTGAPSDGRAVVQGNCAQRVVRGGAWRDNSQGLRVANRSRIARATRDGGIGFRVAASLD